MSLELELREVVSHQIWVLGMEFSPSEGQSLLLATEPSLHKMIIFLSGQVFLVQEPRSSMS